jgi:hypothetical protein
MGTKKEKPGHPGLTMNIYRVNPETFARTPVSSVSFGASEDTTPSPLIYPPCCCTRCTRPASALTQ